MSRMTSRRLCRMSGSTRRLLERTPEQIRARIARRRRKQGGSGA